MNSILHLSGIVENILEHIHDTDVFAWSLTCRDFRKAKIGSNIFFL